jgi:hypothetical protein
LVPAIKKKNLRKLGKHKNMRFKNFTEDEKLTDPE